MQTSSSQKSKKIQLKTFIFNFFLKDKEYRNATESNSQMTKYEFSYLLFKTIIRILMAYNKKSEKHKFFQALFSVLNEQKINQTDIYLYIDALYEELEFFDQQTLNVYLTFYLHNEPTGFIISRITFRRLLQEMIDNDITNNREFLKKGTILAETLTDKIDEQNVLKNVMQAFIFNNDIDLDSLLPNEKKSMSKKELIKRLEKCEKKLMN
jgi:hypothetical protein